MKTKSIPTCYVLFSGGLDSRLALKIMQVLSENETKFKIVCLYYHLPFLKDTRKEIEEFCKEQKAELKIFNYAEGKLFKEYMKVISKPKFGYGTGMNPCIDCHLFIINETKKLLNEKNNDFIATGEVLGERPMSQHKKALIDIEQESGLKGRILRPLSAKLLEKTIPEQEGFVNRNNLYNISGRSRKPQMELANKFKISYPTPAGGCLLCEQVFSERLRDLFKRNKVNEINPRDISLLRIGRHFFFPQYKIIVGRNHEENLLLKQFQDKSEKIYELTSQPGPSVLLQGKIDEESIKKAKEFVLKFSKNKEEIIEK